MMKHMKRIASLLMALVMAAALMVPAMAAGEGQITITNASKNGTYKLYKLLDLESYDKDAKAYLYKVNSAWTEFFATDAAQAYISTEKGYVTWVGEESDARVAAFAALALTYAEEKPVAAVKEYKNESDATSVEFTGLDLGYYLLDSSLGALCRLTTTNPTAEIQDKNAKPTIDKDVKEDSTGEFVDENTVGIGDALEFCVTINAYEGAENYVLHDMMTGMDFTGVTKVEHKPKDGADATLTENTHYTVATGAAQDDECEFENCTFRVSFNQTFCDTLKDGDEIVVYYGSKVNTEAVVKEETITNQAVLEYGENHYVKASGTTTKSFGFEIVKTNEGAKELIDGAQFKIYDALTGGNEVKVVKITGGRYRLAEGSEAGVVIETEDGVARVIGLDAGTYYLEEIKAPDGYNKLSGRKTITITDENLYAQFDAENGKQYDTDSGVWVENKTGSLLPETGGIGTTIFYVLGGVLVLGAGVALVTKKRMV